MNKKSFIIASAALAFIVGEVWVNVAPSMSPLVVALELAAGIACGYYFKKYTDNTPVENKSLKEAPKEAKKETMKKK